MNKFNNFNFIAGELLNQGDILAFDSTNSDSQHYCLKTVGENDLMIGFCNRDCKAGDPIDFIPFKVGEVVHVLISSTATKGSQIGSLPLVAMEAGSSGDLINALCVVA